MRGVVYSFKMILGVVVLSSLSGFAGAQEKINIRFADHPTYSRVVFDWSDIVPYSAEIEKGELKVSFERNALPGLAGLRREPLKFFGNPRHVLEGDKLTVFFEIFIKNGRLKHFRDGTKTAFDIYEEGHPPPLGTEFVSDEMSDEMPDKKEEKIEPETAEPKLAQKAPLPVKISSPLPEKALPKKKRMNDQNFTILELEVESSLIRTDLIYPWTWDTLAAVFIRSNRLWVVFEDKVELDHSALTDIQDGRILSAYQLEDPTGTILVYELTPGQNVSVAKGDGNTWKITLRDNRSVALNAIAVGQQRGSGMGENVFLSANEVGSVFLVKDPVAGDEIAVVPIKEPGTGVLELRRFAEFSVLETAQGAAIQLIADDLDVKRYRNGIGISRGQGLALSKSSLSTAFNPEDASGERPQHLIDFDAWKQGPLSEATYDENRHELLYLLSTSADEKRNAARWNLGRFYLATGHVVDALGVFQLMEEREPELEKSAEFRSALGVTNILLRRYDEALHILTHKSLIAELDGYLWRSVAQNGVGRYQQSLDDFKRGSDVLSLQSAADKARFVFSAIHAAYRMGDTVLMEKFYGLVEELSLSATQLTELDYWRARMTENTGDWEKAIPEYEKIAKSGVRRISAVAQLALVNARYKHKKNTSREAIDALEKLRFSWRGDDFELELLQRLGELYVDQHEYRAGLETLKLAATYFRKSSKTRELTGTMGTIYRDLFLNGKADNMDPIKAVALHNDYPELTPLGADGDRISRRLADRLVSVDLLSDAIEVLEHQVFQRLKGVAQSDVATRLAMIHIMNDAPAEALKVLRVTRQSETPDDIERRRTLIESRALIELARFEEAEVVLEDESGEDVDALRASIYWKMEDWPRVVKSGQAKLSKHKNAGGELESDQRMIILRLALAHYLEGDNAGLDKVRGQYLDPMKGGLYADAFELITNRQEKTGPDARQLTETIAGVAQLENFMTSYRDEFASNTAQN